jgi:hypothetical protein
VPEHQELGILGHLALDQHHQAAEQATNDQVDDRNDHSSFSDDPSWEIRPRQIQ